MALRILGIGFLFMISVSAWSAEKQETHVDYAKIARFLGVSTRAVTQSCSADGVACQYSFDCCSGTCWQGTCGEPNSCHADGVSCQYSFNCCSGTCFEGTCGDPGSCHADGVSCQYSFNCCSGTCWQGRCGSP